MMTVTVMRNRRIVRALWTGFIALTLSAAALQLGERAFSSDVRAENAGIAAAGVRSGESFAQASPSAQSGPVGDPSHAPYEIVDAARQFVATLSDRNRAKALFPFDDEERFNWHYIPRAREGLPLLDMTPRERAAAHALVRSLLSSQGYLKATSIIALEEVLRVIETGPFIRDPVFYYLTIFGEPSMDQPWGWRFEGHHLSLNYSSVAGEGLSVTPAFLGSNPASVRTGPRAGLRVMGYEEDLARALVLSLSERQRTRAIISADAPRDIVTGRDRRPQIDVYEGLPASEMGDGQKQLLRRIIEEYTGNMRREIADEQMAKIEAAGFDKLHFAWAGSTTPGEGHYYRIHGPTVVFEYDNTQDDANHVHSVWRDAENDFGLDLLRKHYEESPHHQH